MVNNKIMKKINLGDMQVVYIQNETGNIGMQLIPASMEEKLILNKSNIESLVQIHIRGDVSSVGFGNGSTMSQTGSTLEFKYLSQDIIDDENEITIITTMTNSHSHKLHHVLKYYKDCTAIESKSIFENCGKNPVIIENLSSFCIGGLTPFIEGVAPNTMVMHRARSWWSAEGRLESQPIEDYQLEPSWSQHGFRVEKFGQLGSMPVKKYFPFIAIEDKRSNVTWAATLSCPSSWQMEAHRRDNGLGITGGLADYDFGHWCKEIKTGEVFETPRAYLTVGVGQIDEISQRILTIHNHYFIHKNKKLPVLFNEFCTTWGVPSAENIKKIVDIIKNRGIDYFIIDAGWYENGKYHWDSINGDWEVSKTLFPNGLDEISKYIKVAGMKPGIWFEFETCAENADVTKNTDWLLKKDGYVIKTTNRSFLDMNNQSVIDYLDRCVIDFLNKYKFEYIKIDYNNTIGIGCDGSESLGEGLRKNMIASQEFFKRIRKNVKNISIENCSSGGHRLEQSMMELCDMASFSDAHETQEIPILAANLHRLILPCQSQIWAVLRKDDSLKRINYTLINTFFGVMCLSGDIYELNEQQWFIVDNAILFYNKVSPIISNGITEFYGDKIKSYSLPTGWQAIVRYNKQTGETLVVVHTFGGEIPKMIELPVQSFKINSMMCSEQNKIMLQDNILKIELKENFEAIAIYLTK